MAPKIQSNRLTEQQKESQGVVGIFGEEAKLHDMEVGKISHFVIEHLKKEFPKIPVIATGGPTDESILETIAAGANAITWTPPSNGDIFKEIMAAYRENREHP